MHRFGCGETPTQPKRLLQEEDSARRDIVNFDPQDDRLALGPFRLSNTRKGPPCWPPLRSESVGGPGARNFDAGPSRDLNFDPISWFDPPLLGSKER